MLRVAFVILCCGIFTAGCSSLRQSQTARTGREQLLLSNAVDQSLAKIDFRAFNGTNLFVEEKYLDCVDKGYLVGSVRHRAMVNGANLVAKAEDADVVLELRSGALGTDSAESYLGSPEIVLPGMLTLPKVQLVSKTQQTATAKIGLLAYDAKSKQLLGEGGVSSALSDDNNWFIVGIGPFQNGTVRKEVERTTPYQSGQPWQELPSQVAFREPQPGERSELRLTNGQRTDQQKPATK